MELKNMIKKIEKLKKDKNAIILAHNYQIPEVQDVADIVGDSLALSRAAAEVEHKQIIFCGVHFMAESAKILSPNKKVYLPVKGAGCPMADMVTAEKLRAYKKQNPGTKIICYVNSSAEVKAESDVCCTSSNAVKVTESLDADRVLFVPDRNLGGYVKERVTNKEVEIWPGFCITHHRVSEIEAIKAKEAKPYAPLLVHPECQEEVVKMANFVGSTSQIIAYAKKMPQKSMIIGTEMGVLHQLRKNNPNKKFYLLSPGLTCVNMKKTTLEDVLNALEYEQHEIHVEPSIREKAFKPLKRMLELS